MWLHQPDGRGDSDVPRARRRYGRGGTARRIALAGVLAVVGLVVGAVVVDVSRPSRAPLTGSAAGTGQVVVRLEGNGLLNVACPVAEGAAPDPCGHQSDGSWVVSLPDEGPGLVLVQLDLSGLT